MSKHRKDYCPVLAGDPITPLSEKYSCQVHPEAECEYECHEIVHGEFHPRTKAECRAIQESWTNDQADSTFVPTLAEIRHGSHKWCEHGYLAREHREDEIAQRAKHKAKAQSIAARQAKRYEATVATLQADHPGVPIPPRSYVDKHGAHSIEAWLKRYAKRENQAIALAARSLLLASSVLLAGCSLNHTMVRVEHTLVAGSEAWDEHVDTEIEKCRAQQLPAEEERKACIEPTSKVDEAVAIAVTAAVAGIRAYWIGVAIGQSPKELKRHAFNVVSAISTLPVEHFGGLRKLAGAK